MPASYPNNVKYWSVTDTGFEYPQDLKTVVYARHVVTIYDEVTAMQQQLGAGGVVTGVAPSSMAEYTSATTSWSSLKARLLNIESGVYQGVTNRVSTAGGSTVTPSTTSTVGLKIKAATSQTANLFEVRNSGDTVVTAIGSSGHILTIDCGSAV